jgi:hypothetical protein
MRKRGYSRPCQHGPMGKRSTHQSRRRTWLPAQTRTLQGVLWPDSCQYRCPASRCGATSAAPLSVRLRRWPRPKDSHTHGDRRWRPAGEVCPHCGETNVFTGFDAMLIFTCRSCGSRLRCETPGSVSRSRPGITRLDFFVLVDEGRPSELGGGRPGWPAVGVDLPVKFSPLAERFFLVGTAPRRSDSYSRAGRIEAPRKARALAIDCATLRSQWQIFGDGN